MRKAGPLQRGLFVTKLRPKLHGLVAANPVGFKVREAETKETKGLGMMGLPSRPPRDG